MYGTPFMFLTDNRKAFFVNNIFDMRILKLCINTERRT